MTEDKKITSGSSRLDDMFKKIANNIEPGLGDVIGTNQVAVEKARKLIEEYHKLVMKRDKELLEEIVFINSVEKWLKLVNKYYELSITGHKNLCNQIVNLNTGSKEYDKHVEKLREWVKVAEIRQELLMEAGENLEETVKYQAFVLSSLMAVEAETFDFMVFGMLSGLVGKEMDVIYL